MKLSELNVGDTFHWKGNIAEAMGAPLMVVVGFHSASDSVMVERADGNGLGYPIGCKPESEIEAAQ